MGVSASAPHAIASRDEDSDCEYEDEDEDEDEDHEGVPSSRVESEARDPGWQVLWQTRDIEVERARTGSSRSARINPSPGPAGGG